MTDTKDGAHADTGTVWGQRIALGAAVILTAKGEFDLAVMAHFAWYVAWLYPVMLDVYVITAFHKRRWFDVIVSLGLMIFSQVAVHLVPVFITEGEDTPWGLVMAVACIAPIVVVRVKALTGKTAAEREAEAEDRKREGEIRNLRAAVAEANRNLATAQAEVRSATQAREATEANLASEAEARAKAEAEVADANRKLADELNRNQAARQETEEKFRAEVTQIVQEAEAEVAALRTRLDDVQASARDARREAADASEQAAKIVGQLDEARAAADRAVVEKVAAEQHIAALTEAHANVRAELERVSEAHARLLRKTEAATSGSGSGSLRRRASGSAAVAGTNRKQIASASRGVPVQVPAVNPNLDGFRPETVAAILDAYRAEPEAKQARVAELTGISTKTIGAVMRAVAEHMRAEVLSASEAEVEQPA